MQSGDPDNAKRFMNWQFPSPTNRLTTVPFIMGRKQICRLAICDRREQVEYNPEVTMNHIY